MTPPEPAGDPSSAFDLAPCPFCGGEAKRLDFETVGTELGGDPNAGGSCITCERCGASSPVHFDRKENLYSSWNERHQQSHAGDDERERLGEAEAIATEARRLYRATPGIPAAESFWTAAHSLAVRNVIAAALRAPPAQSAADIGGEMKNGRRVGWYWLRLNRGDSQQPGYPAGSWIVVQWRGYGFSTLGVQWADVDGLGDETAWATLGPYLGATPPAGGGGA